MTAIPSVASTITHAGTGAINGAGGLVQSANNVASAAQSQLAGAQATGPSLSVAAQMSADQAQDANAADMINLQSQATIQKQRMDTYNELQSMRNDSQNKMQSAMATAAKGIQY